MSNFKMILASQAKERSLATLRVNAVAPAMQVIHSLVLEATDKGFMVVDIGTVLRQQQTRSVLEMIGVELKMAGYSLEGNTLSWNNASNR